MIKYTHGSEDSLDIDVFYVFDFMPSFQDAKSFCDETKEENRNIIVVKDGFVIDCYKGTCDEIQNSLITTYKLHIQEFPLILTSKVERNVILKMVRVMRCFLSHFSKTQYRVDVKRALKSHSYKERLDVLSMIYLNEDEYGKNTVTEVRKVFAFQLAQILGLFDGIEIYSKSDVSLYYPSLSSYVYRNKDVFANDLKISFDRFLNICKSLNYKQIGDIVEISYKGKLYRIDLKDEIVL